MEPKEDKSTTHIELVDGYHGNWTGMVAQLPHKGEVGHVPQNAGLVL